MTRTRGNLKIACTVVFAVFASLALASGVDAFGGAGARAVVASTAAAALREGRSPYEVVPGSDAVRDFENEVLPLASYDEVQASEDGALVGFVSSSDAAETLREIAGEMVDRGWERIESGNPSACSFEKIAGVFRWAFVAVVDVPGGSSVVVSCLR